MGFRNGINDNKEKNETITQVSKINKTDNTSEDKKKTYKILQRIDHCTWIDLAKVIGVEINFRKRGQKEYYEVVFGYEVTSNRDGEGFNTSFQGAIPFIEFRSYDEAIEYVETLGIHLDNSRKMKFNADTWEYNDRVFTYDMSK